MKIPDWLYIFVTTVSSFGATEIEPNNSAATATPIVPGQVTYGQLASASDQDWFGFSMSGPGVVSVAFSSPMDYPQSINDYYTIQVRDSTGTVLASVNSGSYAGANTTFQTGLSTSGAVYVVVLDGPSATLSSAQYSITITNTLSQMAAESEPNNTLSTANPLINGLQVFGQLLSQTDQDWFKIVTSGSGVITVAFDSEMDYPQSINDYFTIQVRDSVGTILASVNSGSYAGANTTFQTGLSTSGAFYVIVLAGPYSKLCTRQYGLTVTSNAAEPPATIMASVSSALEIVWNSSVSNTYVVEWTASLSSTNWFPLSPSLAGTGGGMSYFDSIRGRARGFYRVKENR